MGESITVLQGGNPGVVKIIERGPQGVQGPQGEPGATDYAQLTNIPTSFAPSAHTHTASEVTDFGAEAAAAAPVQSVAGKTGAVALAVADVSGAVADTDARLSDARTPTAHTHTLADITDAGTAAGSATTDFATAAQGALADSSVQPGDLAAIATTGSYADLSNVPATFPPAAHTHVAADVTDFSASAAAAAPVQSVAGKTGAVTLAKADVGLGNVDNTSDLNKPVSTATQTALDGKANTSHTHTASQVTDFNTAAAAAAPVQSVAGRTGAVALAVADVSGAVASTDSRLTDARTPTAHKSTHATGGTDALSPADIGAAPASHTHTPSEVGLGNVANAAQVTAVTGTAPIVSSGGTTPAISINAATTAAAGSMSAADKLKLDGIAAGAEVNVNADWNAGSGDAQILNKPTLGGAAALNVGTTTGTVAAGNDSRFADASALTTGALADARLSSNVPLKDAANTFSANQTVPSLVTSQPNLIALDALQAAADGSGVLALPSAANVLRVTATTTIVSVTGGVVGAFYFVLNQSGGNLQFTNSANLVCRGAANLTLGSNQCAMLVPSGSTTAAVF